MIAIAEYKVGKVAFMPLVEETGIIILSLLASPHIEALIHNDKPHCVAHIEQLRGRGIMRTANGVNAHGLEFAEFAMEGIFVESSTQATKVVMFTDAIDFEILAIEPETRLRVELEITETRGGLYFIDDFTACYELRTYLIYIRILARPLTRFLDVSRLTIGIKPCILNRYLLIGGILIIDFYFPIVDIDTPMLDVDGVGTREPYVAIDATARVPTGIGLIGIIHANSYHILTFMDKGCNVVLETGIAIRAKAYFLPIDINGGVHIDTIELEEDILSASRQKE